MRYLNFGIYLYRVCITRHGLGRDGSFCSNAATFSGKVERWLRGATTAAGAPWLHCRLVDKRTCWRARLHRSQVNKKNLTDLISAVMVFKLKPKTVGFKAKSNRNRSFLVAVWLFFSNFRNGPTPSQKSAKITKYRPCRTSVASVWSNRLMIWSGVTL